MAASGPHQVAGFAGINFIPAGSGLAHHCEGGILVGFELLEGVSNEKKFHEVTLGGSKSVVSDFDLGAEFHHAIGGQVEEVGGG
jgi:hypothetical protein